MLRLVLSRICDFAIMLLAAKKQFWATLRAAFYSRFGGLTNFSFSDAFYASALKSPRFRPAYDETAGAEFWLQVLSLRLAPQFSR